MIGKDTLQVTLTKTFTLKERMRVLFGYGLLQHAFVEITATYKAKTKEVVIKNEMKRIEAFFGRPIKSKKALPELAPPVSEL